MSKKKSSQATALSFLRPHLFKVFLAPTLKVIECITELAVPFLVRAVIDQGLTEPLPGTDYGAHYGDQGFVFTLVGLIFAFALVGFSCTMCSQYLAARVSTDYAYELKKNLYAKIARSSAATLDQFGKGKTLNLLTADAYSLQVGVQLFMRLMVRAPFLVLGSVLAAFLIHPYAGIAILSALLLCALVIFVVLRLTPSRYAALSRELDAISAFGDGATGGGRVLRAFNKQESELSAFQEESGKYCRMAVGIQKINAFINPLTFAFVNLAVVAILYLGSFAYPRTGLSIGSIVALVSFLTQSLAALLQFTRLVTSMSKAFASKGRLDAFLTFEEPIQEGTLEGKGKEGTHLFEFKGVALSFGGERNAIEGIDLTLDEGESIGIIGGTGSGKSTILSLLERFYDPTEGEILYRGVNLKEWKFAAFRDEIALVSQKPQIFEGTLRDNLLLSNPGASQEAIDAAIEDSLCGEYFPHYSDGLDHPVEEGGANLSGGQKQRLLLARALLSARPILVLDDATSALDYKSDLLVRRNIKKRGNLTTILVSQRATSIKDCDRIYVLDAGAIVGVGKHEELLSSCPVYREIYEAQVQAR